MEREASSIIFEADRFSSESSDRLKNIPNDKAFGIRDALLVKCRDTIENLNIELDEEKRSKKHLESKIKELEHANKLLDQKVRQQELHIQEINEELELSISSNDQYKAELKKFQNLKPLQEAQTHMQSTVKSLEHSLAVLQEENLKLKQQLENEKARIIELESDSQYRRTSYDEDRLDLEKIELELEDLYEKKHKCMIKDFERKQDILKEELTNAIDEIELERQRYHDMYKNTVEENNQLRQEIKYLQNMLQRKQSQLEKHSQQSLDQLQTIMEKKNTEENQAYKNLVSALENEKNSIENEKQELENEINRLKDFIRNNTDTQANLDEIMNENNELKLIIKQNDARLQEKAQENMFLNKSIEELKGIVHELESENTQDPKNIELVKYKYQNLLQSELQKRLRDKQDFKHHLIQDKEAFLAKLKQKDDKIAKLEQEKQDLQYRIEMYEQINSEYPSVMKEKRIVPEDTAMV